MTSVEILVPTMALIKSNKYKYLNAINYLNQLRTHNITIWPMNIGIKIVRIKKSAPLHFNNLLTKNLIKNRAYNV